MRSLRHSASKCEFLPKDLRCRLNSQPRLRPIRMAILFAYFACEYCSKRKAALRPAIIFALAIECRSILHSSSDTVTARPTHALHYAAGAVHFWCSCCLCGRRHHQSRSDAYDAYDVPHHHSTPRDSTIGGCTRMQNALREHFTHTHVRKLTSHFISHEWEWEQDTEGE